MRQENYSFERYCSREKGSAQWADPEEIKNAPTIVRCNIEEEICN